MDRQVTPPKQVTSLTWGLLPPCKQALRETSPIAEPGGTPSIRGCAAGQGMVFVLSILNRIYKFARVCPKKGIFEVYNFMQVCYNCEHG